MYNQLLSKPHWLEMDDTVNTRIAISSIDLSLRHVSTIWPGYYSYDPSGGGSCWGKTSSIRINAKPSGKKWRQRMRDLSGINDIEIIRSTKSPKQLDNKK